MDPSTPFRVLDERTIGDSAIFTVIVPEDSPYFDGHFPERRVLPAIGQLAIVGALVRHVRGPSVTLTGVDSLRFSRQVSPGDRVEVRLEAPPDGQTAMFELRCKGARVSRGKLLVASRADG